MGKTSKTAVIPRFQKRNEVVAVAACHRVVEVLYGLGVGAKTVAPLVVRLWSYLYLGVIEA